MSKWDETLHEKMCQIIQNFQIYQFIFLIIWPRLSTLHTRIIFRQYKATISKRNTATSCSQRNLSPLPLHPAHLLPYFLLSSTKQQCCLLFAQVSGSPSPGSSCSWLISAYRALTLLSQLHFKLAFLPTIELATSVMALSQPKCRTVPIWKDLQPCFTLPCFWHGTSLAPAGLFLPSVSIISIFSLSVRASIGPQIFDVFYSPPQTHFCEYKFNCYPDTDGHLYPNKNVNLFWFFSPVLSVQYIQNIFFTKFSLPLGFLLSTTLSAIPLHN